MTTARLRFIALVSLLFAAPCASADELLLHSGRTIRGRITSEDDDSYRIKVRANMALRISKSDVAKVTRDAPEEPARSTARRVRKPEPVKAPVAVEKAAPAKAAPPAEHPAPPPKAEAAAPAPAPKPAAPPASADKEETPPGEVVSPEVPGTSRTVGVVTLNQSTLTAFYPVQGVTFDAAMKSITDSEEGKGFLFRGTRRPSRTQWRLTWYGKPAANGTSWESLVVNSTMTVTLPTWQTRRAPAPAESARWDAMLKDSEDAERGHGRIIAEALENFATEATNLTAPNEEELRLQTGRLLTDARVRSDNRRKGYDRRRAELKQKRPIRRKVAR